MGFPRQEYWNRLPFPSPGDLPGPGIKPVSPALAGGFFTTVRSSSIYSIAMPSVTVTLTHASFSPTKILTPWGKGLKSSLDRVGTELCEMKISPAILINKKCHSHQRFLASKCEWRLPKLQFRGCCQTPPCKVIAEELGERKKQG